MKTKYQQLAQDRRNKGWVMWLMAVEAGCRGIPGSISVESDDKSWTERQKRKAIHKLGEAADRGSGIKERKLAGSLEGMGSDLANHC